MTTRKRITVGRDLLGRMQKTMERVEKIRPESKQVAARTTDSEVRDAVFILHETINACHQKARATKLVPLRNLGDDYFGWHMVFDQNIYLDDDDEEIDPEEVTITVDGTALSGTFTRDSTTDDIQSAIDSALPDEGIQGAVVAGNLFIWPAQTVTTDSKTVWALKADYRPMIREEGSHDVGPHLFDPSPYYNKGEMYVCNWMTGFGYHLMPLPDIMVGQLMTDLDEAENFIEAPQKGEVYPVTRHAETGFLIPLKVNNIRVRRRVANRFEFIYFEKYTFMTFHRVLGEYVPLTTDCEASAHRFQQVWNDEGSWSDDTPWDDDSGYDLP